MNDYIFRRNKTTTKNKNKYDTNVIKDVRGLETIVGISLCDIHFYLSNYELCALATKIVTRRVITCTIIICTGTTTFLKHQ